MSTTAKTTSKGTVQMQREGHVATLIFDNPPRNMLTTGMFEELGRHVHALDADPDVRAVVIRGAGERLYTVGADIGEMDVVASWERREANAVAWLGGIHAVLDAIERSPKVYLCAMKGHSYGGGLETAAACDIRIAASDARFAMPEVKLGIIPGYGGTQRIARLIGMGHALTMVLGAREINATTAEQWGLVDVVTPAGEAESTALAMAQAIGDYAPIALANAKRAIRAGADLDLSAGLSEEMAHFIACATSRDFDEGRRAFHEKRRPVFQGA
ncbi:MAG TPA: enoyl-CoA hydratase/isomerase family protein [Ktedonobacterales bacterium]|nr:enoyl-CoA hydratase/isomerase family protein [Ktedonobacterales bacterium]